MNFSNESLRNVFVATITTCLFCCTVSSFGQQDGAAKVDYPSLSIEKLVELGEQGDSEAFNRVGMRYHAGRGVEKNMVIANQWYRRAAEAGNHYAQNNLGRNAFDGVGMEKDLQKARQLLTMAAEGGVPQAQNQLGVIYESGLGVESDVEAAAQWYQKSAEQNFGPAQSNYGVCLIYGRGVERNMMQGLEWIGRSARQYDPNGLHNLGYAYAQGWFGKKDLVKTSQLFRLAVWAGHPDAIVKLKKLAEAGEAEAQFQLALLYQNGERTTKDVQKAREWYEQAAKLQHMQAVSNLGTYYEFGVGVEKDPVKAVEFYRQAAAQGNADALNLLGKCYFKGTGIGQDSRKAVVLLQMAADQNHPEALNNYGYTLEHGTRGEKSPDQAAEFYFRAAIGGNKQAEASLRRLSAASNEVAKRNLELFEKQGQKPRVNSALVEPSPVKRSAPEATAKLQELYKQFSEGEYPVAIDGLYEFVHQFPNDDLAWYLLGAAYDKVDMFDEAMEAFDKAIAINPEDQKHYLGKTGILEKQKRYHLAAETFEQSSKHIPRTTRLLQALVTIESKAKRYRHVVQFGEMSWALNENASTAFELAIANHFLGNHPERDYFVEAHKRLGGDESKLANIFATSEELKGQKSQLMKWMASTHRSGNFDKMLADIRRYLNYDPNSAELWAVLGGVHLNDFSFQELETSESTLLKYKDSRKAVELFSTAVYFDPSEIDHQHKLARALIYNGELQRATDQYQQTMKAFPDASKTFALAAIHTLNVGSRDEAIQLAEKAWNMDKTNPEVAIIEICFYYVIGDDKKSETFMQDLASTTIEKLKRIRIELQKTHPNSEAAFYGNRGRLNRLVRRINDLNYRGGVALDANGRPVEIMTQSPLPEYSPREKKWRRKQLSKALEDYLSQFPKSFEAMTLLGEVYSNDGQFEKSDAMLSRAKKINPDYFEIYYALARRALLQEDHEAAKKYYKLVQEKSPGIFQNDNDWWKMWFASGKDFKWPTMLAEVLWEFNQQTPWIPGRLAEGYHHLGEYQKRDLFLDHARKLGYSEIDRLEKLFAEKSDGDTRR